MPIPQHILSVERPRNSVVICYGKNKDHYAVRERVGCKYVNGRHVPVNGPTIGHIVDGKYVPNAPVPPVSMCDVDLKDWANVELCHKLSKDVLGELKAVYNESDASKLYCIAILRICNPGIKDCELKEAYETSFLSELFPGLALSRNTVCKFLNDVGKACSRIAKFMQARTAAVNIDHHLLVDGTLKTNTSRINSLSDFSHKARLKGSRDISILYAFDLETKEPICSKCFPGNMLDATAYESFIADNKITKGIIVGDKGFPSSAATVQGKSQPAPLESAEAELQADSELRHADFYWHSLNKLQHHLPQGEMHGKQEMAVFFPRCHPGSRRGAGLAQKGKERRYIFFRSPCKKAKVIRDNRPGKRLRPHARASIYGIR